MKLLILAGAALAALSATPALAVTITFDELSEGVNYPSLSYDDVSFTPSTGAITVIKTSGGNGRICPNDNPWGCIADLTVSFTSAVENLTFELSGINDRSTRAATAEIFHSGGVTMLDLFGTQLNGNFQNLTSFGGITSLVLRSDDTLGVSYDNFSFDVAEVPEPAAFATLALGAGLAGFASRRRKTVRG